MAEKFKIIGGETLKGEVSIGGAKNAVLKLPKFIKDKEDNKYFNLIINDYKRGYNIKDIAKKYEMSISEVYKYIEPYISK